MVVEQLYDIYLRNPSVQTDSRQIKKGDLFFALRGVSFDGNKFAARAIESGASFAIIDDPESEIPGRTILVENALTTLQHLARHHRQQFKIPFLAITGSNGKTTTKELVHAALSTSFHTYTTEGNLNNHIGIPLTILKIRSDAEIAVIEMGANHQGEIRSYCEIALPTHGLITNCGKAHLEGFGGEEGVKKGKGELFDHLRTHGGTAFVMWDYDYLRQMSRGIPVLVSYGTRAAALCGMVSRQEPFLSVTFQHGFTGVIHTQLVGDYNLPNVLAAVSVGKFFNVPDEKIRSAIENYQPSNSRSQLIEKGNNKIILDAYNANPSSMKLAIENFASLNAPVKVLLLGSMAELGEASSLEHQSIIDLIKKFNWKDVALVGEDFSRLNHPYHSFKNVADARSWLHGQHFQNTFFLVKGSRAVQMEKIFENGEEQ